MKTNVVRCAVILVLGVAVSCGGGPTAGSDIGRADADGRALFLRLGDLATQRAREVEPAATVREVRLTPGDGRYEYRFVDAAALRMVTATGGASATTPGAFVTAESEVDAQTAASASPIDLASVRMGPDGVVAAVVRALGAATPRSLVLLVREGRLTWDVVVNGPQGIVRGTVPDETGQFLSDAP